MDHDFLVGSWCFFCEQKIHPKKVVFSWSDWARPQQKDLQGNHLLNVIGDR